MLLATADTPEIDEMDVGDVRRLAHRLVAENAALQAEKLDMAAKLAWFLIQCGACYAVLQRDPARRALVRAWRSCGYLYQIARSSAGKI